MVKKPLISAAAAVCVLLMSCGDSVVENYEEIEPFVYLGLPAITVERAEPVVLEFSETIDNAESAVSSVTVEPDQPVEVRYDAGKLTVTPYEDWNTNGGVVTIEISEGHLISVKKNPFKGVTVTVNVKIDDDLSLTPVTGLVFDSIPHDEHPNATAVGIPHFYSISANVKWNKIRGIDVTGYKVYYREEGESFYKPAPIVWSDFDYSDALAFATIRLNGANPIRGKTNTFVVQAYNNRSLSALEEGAATLDVFSRPTLTTSESAYAEVAKLAGDSVVIWNGNQILLEQFLYTAFATNGGDVNTQRYTVRFTEPMDNSNVIEGNWDQSSLPPGDPEYDQWRRVRIEAAWGDANGARKETMLTVTVTYITPQNGTLPTPTLGGIYSFSGLKSKSGKPFFVEYTNLPQSYKDAGITKIIKPTLDFRIRARR